MTSTFKTINPVATTITTDKLCAQKPSMLHKND
jgi:hypothetical protein